MCKENEIGFKEALAFDICFTQRFSNTALFFFFSPHTSTYDAHFMDKLTQPEGEQSIESLQVYE